MHSVFVKNCVIIHRIDDWQIMPLSDFVIINIVSRSNFQSSSSEFDINIIILDNWNYTIYNWNNYVFTFQMLVSFVIRIYTNCNIAKNSFRTSRCNS